MEQWKEKTVAEKERPYSSNGLISENITRCLHVEDHLCLQRPL